MDSYETSLYSHSRYLRPKLRLSQYTSLFTVGVVSGSILSTLKGHPIIFLAMAIVALVMIGVINKI